jgi:hypothetical protein
MDRERCLDQCRIRVQNELGAAELATRTDNSMLDEYNPARLASVRQNIVNSRQ